ncbi:MAG: hypothetical protein ACLGIS_18475 [Actinomycetes bacterium]
MPFLLEITLLVIGLPLAFAWLLALAGLVTRPIGGFLTKLRSTLHPPAGSSPEH